MIVMLTQKRLKELLYYDPYSGWFTWIVHRGSAKAGDKAYSAKSTSRGEYYICINYTLYAAQKLAWLYMKGYIPLVCKEIV